MGNVKLTGPKEGDYKPLTETEYQALLKSYTDEQLAVCGNFIAAFAAHASPSVRPAYDAVLGEILAESRTR